MAQQYAPYPGYVDPTAKLIAEMISRMGEEFAAAITTRAGNTAKEKEYNLEAVKLINAFQQEKDPEERQRMLANPATRRLLLQALDPHLFSKHSDKKEGVTYDYGQKDYGTRADGTPKGLGFLGPLQRPDGKVSSEISIGVNIDGKETEIPTLVPTLKKDEVQWLLKNDISDPTKIPKSIVDKATAFAKGRIKQGKDPFAGPGEQHNTYSDIPRVKGKSSIESSLDAMGQPTFLDKERASKQMAETGKAQAEEQTAKEKNLAMEDYKAKAASYNKGGPGAATAAEVIQAAGRAGVSGSADHPENILHPEYAVTQQAAKTPGTPEFYKQSSDDQYKVLVEKYNITNDKERAAVRQLADTINNPGAPKDLLKDLPKTMDQEKLAIDKRNVAVSEANLRETQFTNDFKLQQYLTSNGIDEKKAGEVATEVRKTGKLPKGFLLPKDQKTALDLQISQQQLAEVTEKVRIAKNFDPELEDMIKAAQQYTGSENANARAALADKIWERVKSRYPDLQAKPKQSWWDWFFEKGSSAANTGAAGAQYGIALGSSAASAASERSGHVPEDVLGAGTPPIVSDVANAAIGGARAAADVAEPGARAVVGATLEGTNNFANAMNRLIAYTVPGFSKETRKDLQKGIDWPSFSSPFAFAHSMRQETPIGGVKPSLKDMQIQRDQHMQNMLNLAKDPNTTAEDKMRIRAITEAIQAAGDDPDKLSLLLTTLGARK